MRLLAGLQADLPHNGTSTLAEVKLAVSKDKREKKTLMLAHGMI